MADLIVGVSGVKSIKSIPGIPATSTRLESPIKLRADKEVTIPPTDLIVSKLFASIRWTRLSASNVFSPPVTILVPVEFQAIAVKFPSTRNSPDSEGFDLSE